MTSVKLFKQDNTYYIEEPMNEVFELENEFPKTNSEWSDYLKQFDVSLKEDLPLNLGHFDALSDIDSISELWKDFITSHPLSGHIQVCLDKLNPIQKQVIHLMFWQGLSLRAIAEQLKMSKTSVVRYRNAALKRLKHEISKHVPTNTKSVHKI